MENKEREILKLKLGLALIRVIEENKQIARDNKDKGYVDHKLVTSLRKLAAASEIDFGSVQKISVGEVGPEYVNFIALINALDKNLLDFAKYFDNITEKEVWKYKESIEEARRERLKKKKQEKKQQGARK